VEVCYLDDPFGFVKHRTRPSLLEFPSDELPSAPDFDRWGRRVSGRCTAAGRVVMNRHAFLKYPSTPDFFCAICSIIDQHPYHPNHFTGRDHG
jgi:hypothetical protein